MLKTTKNIKQQGFTIIELLIVIAIIGILALLVVTNFQGAQAKARDSVRKADINSMYAKLEEFYGDFGYYPAQIPGSSIMPGLDGAATIDADGTAITATLVTTAPATVTYSNTGEYKYSGFNCTNTTATALTALPTSTPANVCAKYTLGSFIEKDASGKFEKTSAN